MLSVRELSPDLVHHIVNYWTTSSDDHLIGMGVDIGKLPAAEEFETMLLKQIALPDKEKNAYALIWFNEIEPIGHCNLNPIQYGVEANMHLHMWHADHRQKGMGKELVKLSLPWFFEKFKLHTLICEPYAQNPAPHKTLPKVGFKFEKRYETVPGAINFMQEVNRWVMTRDMYNKLGEPDH